MSKKHNKLKGYQSFPLPSGWEVANDIETGKVYYVDHSTKKTQWIDPRDRLDYFIVIIFY